jgi:hypothetical protein
MQIGTILAIVPDNHSEPILRAAKESPIEGFAVEVLMSFALQQRADRPSRPFRRPDHIAVPLWRLGTRRTGIGALHVAVNTQESPNQNLLVVSWTGIVTRNRRMDRSTSGWT